MTAPRLLIIQPDETDPVGPLGEWLTGAGAELDIRLPPRDELPDDLSDHQGVVCLGGGMGAQSDDEHPWLKQVRRLLGLAAGTSTPTLGICLGAQLLTVATGGRVERGKDGPEVGGALVSKKDTAWTDPLCADLPLMPDVMQFHQDVITLLPPGAELLASAPRYPNQAFRLNRCAYGVQFHIETTSDIVRRWVADDPELAAFGRSSAFEPGTLTQVHADIADTWRPFAERFVHLADGKLSPAQGTRNSLPLV